jgi:hypothetical protein
VTRRTLGPVAAVAVVSALISAPAIAAPVTVNLRIEGPTSTLFEGAVTTDVRPFQFTAGADVAPHPCDGSPPAGTSTTPVPTRGAAITAAAQASGLATAGTFNTQFGSPSFDTIAGQDVRFNAATSEFLAEYKNGAPSQTGACGDPIASGDDVVFGYSTGNGPVLKLTGPATAAPGAPVALRVTDEATGAPIAGAGVGGQVTGADGAATVGPFAQTGPQTFKATKSGAVRSNALGVCVTSGADGACGTTGAGAPGAPGAPGAGVACATTGDDGLCGTKDRRAPRGKILSIREKQRFAKGKGPRLLKGDVASDPSGLGRSWLRLERIDAHKCSTYNSRNERFLGLKRCGIAHATWFPVGTDANWSYLLPERLPRGRYVLDLRARDRAGNVDTLLQRTRTRVVFTVS